MIGSHASMQVRLACLEHVPPASAEVILDKLLKTFWRLAQQVERSSESEQEGLLAIGQRIAVALRRVNQLLIASFVVVGLVVENQSL
jgi:hypothetical protein